MQGSYFKVLGLALLFMLTTLPAQATPGALFPPEGLSGTQQCPTGTVMGWSGRSVQCVDPLSGRIGDCPGSQVLTGIVNGVPQCEDPLSARINDCPGGQVLTGIVNGVPQCSPMPSGSPPGTLCGYLQPKWDGSMVTAIACNGHAGTNRGNACPAGYVYREILAPVAPRQPIGQQGALGLGFCVKQ